VIESQIGRGAQTYGGNGEMTSHTNVGRLELIKILLEIFPSSIAGSHLINDNLPIRQNTTHG